MSYTLKYANCSRDSLIEKVSQAMSKERFNHVLRVEKEALRLATKYEVDQEKASIAALLHDLAKELDDITSIQLIKEYDLSEDMLDYGNFIWHGPVAACLAKRDFGITDQDILDAISEHTVGSIDMSELSKLLYVADYIEEGRSFPAVEEARKLAYESLEACAKFESTQTLKYLLNTNKRIYPRTLEVYNSWVDQQL